VAQQAEASMQERNGRQGRGRSEQANAKPAVIGMRGALTSLQQAVPDWQSITLREGLPRRRGAPSPAQGQEPPEGQARSEGQATGAGRTDQGAPVIQAYSATIQRADAWPYFATEQLVIDAFTGEIMSASGYPDMTGGRKLRSWMRYLHTGQALGLMGQLLAFLGSVGGLFLVWTGFALSWRRFVKKPACKQTAAGG
jgi:uncharacterized iron-regulated membrane protein